MLDQLVTYAWPVTHPSAYRNSEVIEFHYYSTLKRSLEPILAGAV
jgi:hypothetical protein